MTAGHIKNLYLAENFYTPEDPSPKGPNFVYLYETELSAAAKKKPFRPTAIPL